MGLDSITPEEMLKQITQAVVEYIKKNRSVNDKAKIIYVNDIVNAIKAKLNISEVNPIEEKQMMLKFIEKNIRILEEVGAIKAVSNTPKTMSEYIEYKKYIDKQNQLPNVARGYYASEDYLKKIKVLKDNEKILASGVAEVELNDDKTTLLIVKDVDYDQVKVCNEIFDYSKIASYIGAYNKSTKKVDFVSTSPNNKCVYYFNNAKHVSPKTREIINLYYLVNMSDYKKMFVNSDTNTKQSILSLRDANAETISTDKLTLMSYMYHML